MEAVRFTLVLVFGLSVDILLALALVRYIDLPVWLAATCSFSLAALMNYFMHEFWTFTGAMRKVSGFRAMQYLAGSVLTLCVRLVTILFLSIWIGENYSGAILLFAAAASFGVNFAFSKFIVFTRR